MNIQNSNNNNRISSFNNLEVSDSSLIENSFMSKT